MRILRTGNTWMLAVAALVAGSTASAGIAAQDTNADQGLRIDRWLMSDPIAVDSVDPSGEAKVLSGAGEFGVLPRRGQEIADTRWTLVRTDSAAESIRLDSLVRYVVEPAAAGAFRAVRDSVDAPYVVFAHTYIRSPEDRNVRVDWHSKSCSLTDLRLNGSRVHGEVELKGSGTGSWLQGLTAEVRLAAGWNTLLARFQVPEALPETPEACGMLNIRLRPAYEGRSTLDGIRVQGSRPHGQVRTGPEPWVVFGWLRPVRTWRADRLTIDIPVPVTLWSRAVLDSVRLRIRGPDTDERMTLRDLHIGRPDTAAVRIPFDAVRKLIKEPSLRVEARWHDQKLEETLRVHSVGLGTQVEGTTSLAGWVTETDKPGDGEAAVLGPALPSGAGILVRGRWIVPEELAGSSIQLSLGGSPGEYMLGGEPLGGEFILCSECEEGAVMEISASTTAAWREFPSVIVE
ncbi:MAG: hypothetical protein ABFS14_04210 [Gemmatimonadota bacterium]